MSNDFEVDGSGGDVDDDGSIEDVDGQSGMEQDCCEEEFLRIPFFLGGKEVGRGVGGDMKPLAGGE